MAVVSRPGACHVPLVVPRIKSALFGFMAIVASLHAEPGPQPVDPARALITLPVRIHLVQSDTDPAMHTTLVRADIERILGKVNAVWARAGIRFEAESIAPTEAMGLAPGARFETEFERVKAMIPRDRLSADALDIC